MFFKEKKEIKYTWCIFEILHGIFCCWEFLGAKHKVTERQTGVVWRVNSGPIAKKKLQKHLCEASPLFKIRAVTFSTKANAQTKVLLICLKIWQQVSAIFSLRKTSEEFYSTMTKTQKQQLLQSNNHVSPGSLKLHRLRFPGWSRLCPQQLQISDNFCLEVSFLTPVSHSLASNFWLMNIKL